MILFLITIISPLNLAESLFIHKDFYDAITEYKRFIFLNPQDSLADYARLRIGLCYKELRDYSEAVEQLKGLLKRFPFQAGYNLAQIYLKQGNYLKAEAQLNTLLDRFKKPEVYSLLGLVNLYKGDIDKAENYLLSAHKDSLVLICKELRRLPYKNPDKARLLSMILPGSGEIYTHHYKIGILSLLANSLCIAGIGISLKEKRYVDALLIFHFLFQRFYIGSQNNAYDFAREYNERIFKEKVGSP